jgi:hypothetical protein
VRHPALHLISTLIFHVFRTDCCWRLPLWLLLFGVMVSVLTLSYLLTGTVYPNSWTRFGSESLDMFTASEGFYCAGHQPSTIDDAASNMVEPVSHATLDRVFAQISRSGDITMVPSSIGRPSPCGPATLVDNTVRRALCTRFLIRRNTLAHGLVWRRFPCSFRSACHTTHHVVRDARLRLASRSRGGSRPRARSRVCRCGL